MSVWACKLPHMTDSPSLRVVFLGSGSSGNATLVTCGADAVLIDCGFSARETARRMSAVGLDADSVSAVFVTHEHSDHIRGVEVFARRHSCAVYATPGTARGGNLRGCCAEVHDLRAGQPVRVGALELLPFVTSHDALEPVGLRVDAAGTSLGLATDTGVLTEMAAEALLGVSVLALECNHDLEMLDGGPYPYFLKQRIRSTRGHLSNADAADALERLATDSLLHVIAMHRSRTNNTAILAEKSLSQRLAAIGHAARVDVAMQDDCLDTAPPQGQLFAE
jgi:phosphoribosyl 1,2-cyclic phosphodiesterase